MTMAAARPVSARVRAWLGWTLAVGTIALCGAGTNFADAARGHLPLHLRSVTTYVSLTPIFAIAFALVGALIVWRRPGNRIGWVCCGIGILWGLEEFVFGFYAYAAYAPHRPIPETRFVNWLTSWIWIPPVVLT